MKLTKTQKILLGTAITGVGAYFLYKYFFPADQESDEQIDTNSGESTGSGGSGGSGGTSNNPLGSYQNVINFQKYYNKNKPMIYLDLVVDGIYGKDTKLAYKNLGQQYQTYLLSGGAFINAFTIT